MKEQRNSQIEWMFRCGSTMESIGNLYGLSRERVRQILEKRNVTFKHGGAHVRAKEKKRRIFSKRDKQCRDYWGFSLAEMESMKSYGFVRSFTQQRNNAKNRGIAWLFSFREWVDVWQASGKAGQRGRGKGKYVMSRIGDSGPYSKDNVVIQLAVQNSRDAVKAWQGKPPKKYVGVFCSYPGRAMKWQAKVGKKSLGFFEIAEQAALARASYLELRGCLA